MMGAVGMVVVIGSVNMDVSVSVDRLPRAGETLLGGTVHRSGGGKGANQAVAAARASSERSGSVAMAGAIGDDAFGEACRANLKENDVDIGAVRLVGEPTGCAFIAVDA